jgi:hypothetical protein
MRLSLSAGTDMGSRSAGPPIRANQPRVVVKTASKDVHFKKGESLWDRAARAIDAAEKSEGAKGGTEK